MRVQKSTVSNWRHGKTFPNLDDLSELARVLKVSTDWLLGLVDYPEARLPITPERVAADERESELQQADRKAEKIEAEFRAWRQLTRRKGGPDR